MKFQTQAEMRPKKNVNKIRYKDRAFGNERRLSYLKEIYRDEPYFPKPLAYEDIDNAVFDFLDKEIELAVNGERVPTFKLYSNQRFSEYSQNWEHTDEDGNLLLNFKTVSRENNADFGDNQGGLWNIPGERYYTTRIRTVLDQNGTESYEIYSMKQPYSVDLVYNFNFVTDKFSMLNEFNGKLNQKFSSRQCYIRPNSHYIPMVVESVNDETTYSVDDRKFFMQSAEIKVMAYIINAEDFKVEKRPKRIMLCMEGDRARPKPVVNIDEYDDVYENKSLELNIDFDEYQDKVSFTMDTDMNVETTDTKNIRNMRLSVNGTPYFIDKGFKVKDGDEIRIKIRVFDPSEKSSIRFVGYDPNATYEKNDTPESVSDEPTKHEVIDIV